MSTSFVQYKYCSLCRVSCKKVRKHVHSKKHQEIVKNILAKCLKKISDAKSLIENPVTKDVSWSEAGKKIWCYFCACDVDLHLHQTTMVGDCVLVGAGFLGHITRKDHSEKTAKFLKDNLIDMTRTPQFLLNNDIFLKFLEKAETISVAFLNEKNTTLRKAANVIRYQNEFRQRVVKQGLLEQQSQNVDLSSTKEEARDRKSSNNSVTGQPDCERKKTVQAFGDGLTVMERLNEDDSLGNIHSNAVPPWLRQDEEEETGKDRIIGPSMGDWMKQKKLELKRKLPACRVGAKFDHKTNQGNEWLPDFGGVWSHGPRTKAGQQFKKRQNSPFQKYGDQSKLINSSNTSLTSPGPSHHHSAVDHPPTDNTSLSFSYHHTESDNFTQNHFDHHTFHQHLPSNSVDSTSVSNIQTHFGGNNPFDLSALPSKSVRPYISKRRKIGQAGCTYSSPGQTSCTYSSPGQSNYTYSSPGQSNSNYTFSSPSSSESFYSNEHFSSSSHLPNFSQQSFAKPTVNGNDNVNRNEHSTSQKTSSCFRLLSTPVLISRR